MAFYIYDLTFLILFSLGVGIFLWKRRKNLQREGIMYLYRTKIGVKFIDYVGTKYKKTIRAYGILGIICGYALMAAMIYFLYYLVKIYLFNPEIVQAIKIPPLMPLIPYLPSLFKVSFLPPFYFTYWILAIAIIAIFHEFAHGIVARRYGIKIKTTGFGFLGPFLAAFVEPDEKQMQKKPKFQQLSVLSAGVFANLILAVLFFLLLAVFFALTYAPAGAIFNSYAAEIVPIASITSIDGVDIPESSTQGLLDIIDKKSFTVDLNLGEGNDTIDLTKIYAGNRTYLMNIKALKHQLEQNQSFVILYGDLPAINNKLGKVSNNQLNGIIVEINGKKITNHKDISNVLSNLNPEDKISLVTRDEEGYSTYEFELGKSSTGKAMIGLGYAESQKSGIIARIVNFFNFFREPSVFYEPKFNPDLVLFIYNLIWWIALINLSVALVNMWPVAIFDGGRFFMLTVWGITKSEKAAQLAFKIVTYIILVALFILMLGWFLAIF